MRIFRAAAHTRSCGAFAKWATSSQARSIPADRIANSTAPAASDSQTLWPPASRRSLVTRIYCVASTATYVGRARLPLINSTSRSASLSCRSRASIRSFHCGIRPNFFRASNESGRPFPSLSSENRVDSSNQPGTPLLARLPTPYSHSSHAHATGSHRPSQSVQTTLFTYCPNYLLMNHQSEVAHGPIPAVSRRLTHRQSQLNTRSRLRVSTGRERVVFITYQPRALGQAMRTRSTQDGDVSAE